MEKKKTGEGKKYRLYPEQSKKRKRQRGLSSQRMLLYDPEEEAQESSKKKTQGIGVGGLSAEIRT